jgi:hypothetical protein
MSVSSKDLRDHKVYREFRVHREYRVRLVSGALRVILAIKGIKVI